MPRLILIALLADLCSAFSPSIPPRATRQAVPESWLKIRRYDAPSRSHSVMQREMSAEEVQEPRKRRRRKDGKRFDAEPAPSTPPPPPPAPKERVVVMQVRDINAVVSGAPEEESVEPNTGNEPEVDDDVLADDEEWEYYEVDDDGNEIFDDADELRGRTTDDSLEQLLADARSMRTRNSDESSLLQEEGTSSSSMKDTFFDVVSTIVTIDFFVVIGLLVWFIAGIFCSSVLGNDTVQIAFNMNFEKITQPALGILMIGSIAGAVGNKDEEER